MIITKEKNILSFFMEDDTTKVPYKLDINTGIFYGKSGKPVKGAPSKFWFQMFDHRYDNNITYFLTDIHGQITDMTALTQEAKYLSLMDKAQNIGYKIDSYACVDRKTLDEVDKHFKLFVKFFKEVYQQNDENAFSKFCEWREEKAFNELLDSISDEHFTPVLRDFITRHRGEFTQKQLPYVIYYITRGLYDFCQCEPTSVRYGGNSNEGTLLYMLREYFRLCKETNTEPQKEDFYRSFINLRRTYVIKQSVINTQKFQDHYNSRPWLSFENDDCFVMIPKTTEDFLNEANQQRNCVYSMYMPKVLRGETNVVFIRKKDNPNKSYITCEISDNGKIRQYLAFSNKTPNNDEIAEEFCRAYINHLKANCRKGK